MENLEKILILEIRNYVEMGYWLTGLFNVNYDIIGSPLENTSNYKGIIPFIGVLNSNIGEIAYQFHGYGCRFTLPSSQVVEVSYPAPKWLYNGTFNFYCINEFIEFSLPKLCNSTLLEKSFISLENAGFIEAIMDVNKPIGPNLPKYKAYKLGR